ncbi:MAG: MTH938/NDUFAF3 family protein [Pseudomonadota bacterium]
MLAATTIRQVSADGIRIADRVYTGTLAVTTDSVVEDWTHKTIPELLTQDFAGLLEQQPEVVLLGTGATPCFAPRELMFGFARLGIGFETMDTKAAARTFNVLAGEDRRVVAVLFPDTRNNNS